MHPVLVLLLVHQSLLQARLHFRGFAIRTLVSVVRIIVKYVLRKAVIWPDIIFSDTTFVSIVVGMIFYSLVESVENILSHVFSQALL